MENMTRQELLNFMKSKETELEELRTAISNGEPVDFGKMDRIEREIEEAESELEKIAELEGEYDSGVNLSAAREEREEKTIETQEQDNNEELINDVQQQEIEEEMQEEERQIDDGEKRLSVIDWQLETGVDIVADSYINQKYPEKLTEQEFKNILKEENVPIIIQEPGRADKYFKDDMQVLRTSKSALEQAILSGNFPTKVNDQSYILLLNNEGIIYDKDNDKQDDGYGVIDREDIYAELDKEESTDEREEVEENIEKNIEEGILNEISVYYKDGFPVVSGQAIAELATKSAMINVAMQANTNIANSLVGNGIDVAELVGKAALSKINRTMDFDIEHPEIGEEEKEREEDDFGEIPAPPGGVL